GLVGDRPGAGPPGGGAGRADGRREDDPGGLASLVLVERAGGPHAGALEPGPAADVPQQADGHADGGGAEAEVPAVLAGEVGGDEDAEEGPEVDAHVEHGEPGVAAGLALVVVEPADHDGDIGFEQAR